jgi:hypothetical protein
MFPSTNLRGNGICCRLAKDNSPRGFDMKPDGDKGWRRVVASPEPKEILEARAIQVNRLFPASSDRPSVEQAAAEAVRRMA